MLRAGPSPVARNRSRRAFGEFYGTTRRRCKLRRGDVNYEISIPGHYDVTALAFTRQTSRLYFIRRDGALKNPFAAKRSLRRCKSASADRTTARANIFLISLLENKCLLKSKRTPAPRKQFWLDVKSRIECCSKFNIYTRIVFAQKVLYINLKINNEVHFN